MRTSLSCTYFSRLKSKFSTFPPIGNEAGENKVVLRVYDLLNFRTGLACSDVVGVGFGFGSGSGA